MRLGRVRLCASVGIIAVLSLAAACGGHAASSAASASPSPSATPSAIPTTAPPGPAKPLSPLTGLPVSGPAPVVAVKIDNVYTGPQSGLNNADLVYVEQVEGGLTRLLAVFSGQLPTGVGPVRSARQSDLELLGQFGKIALAFSGANAAVAEQVAAANVEDDSYDNVPPAYHFDTTRPAPYQFLADVAYLAAHRPGVDAKNIGFLFGATLPKVSAVYPATVGSSLEVHYPAADIEATWDAALGVYLMSHNGEPEDVTSGGQANATNILIEYVRLTTTQYVDHDGNPTPFSVTIGSGKAVLYRDGTQFTGTWSRATQSSPTSWTSSAGGPLRLGAGRTWVLLVPIGTSVTTS